MAALDGMPLWGLALGLGWVHLSLGLTLHALITSKVVCVSCPPICVSSHAHDTPTNTSPSYIYISQVPLYLRLAHLEFHVLTPRWWWRVAVYCHAWGAVMTTALLALAARVMTLRGGLAESPCITAFLLALQLDNLGEDKLLLIAGTGLLSLLVALAATGLHLAAGSNRALNVGLVVLLDRLGVLKPLEVRPYIHTYVPVDK